MHEPTKPAVSMHELLGEAGLLSIQLTARERAQERLKTIDIPEHAPWKDFCLTTLEAQPWEHRHAAVLASVTYIQRCYTDSFSIRLLPRVRRLIIDEDVRVRQALAQLVEEWARKRPELWDELRPDILADIYKCREMYSSNDVQNGQARRQNGQANRHETEGWGSLETSMRCLSAIMRGIGPSFMLTDDILQLLQECSAHSNRYVREYAYFAIASVAAITTSQDWCVQLLAAGLKDNWSQVRYASSVATRALVANPCFNLAAASPHLVPLMCLNRHYVAEGVRLYSQETWRLTMPATGGGPVLMSVFPQLVQTYVESTNAPNHAVREAACKCISELGFKIAGSPQSPTPYRVFFTSEGIEKLIQALLSAFHDESWPVRDVASTAMAYFVHAFPEELSEHRDQLLQLWLWQLGDNIPSLRKNGAWALVHAAKVYEDYVPILATRLPEMLEAVQSQSEESKTFAQYTPSGPFSVPQKKFTAHADYTPEPAVNNQTMYSCGSLAPKTLKKFNDKGGCMNCTVHREEQQWELTEGAAQCLAELAKSTPQAQAIVRSLPPQFILSFRCDHFPHHVNLKSSMCSVLPSLVEVCGQEAFSELIHPLEDAAAQDGHRNLKLLAEEALQSLSCSH